jgi:hypothetical protein
MNTTSIVILICFAVLNIVGIVLYSIVNKDKLFKKEWWLNVLWMILCGVTYIPFGIYKLCKKE